MPLTSMQMTQEEAKDYAGVPEPGNAPKYPYGLCLCLNTETLKKLGIDKLPEVGAELLVSAKATVTMVRASQQLDGDKEQGIDLQITDMALSAPTPAVDPAAVMFDTKPE